MKATWNFSLDSFELPNQRKKNEPEEETNEVPLEEIKDRGISAIRTFMKHDTTHQGFVKCTKSFVEFSKSELCDHLVIAAIYYVSSSLFLTESEDLLDEDFEEEQMQIQAQAKQIISSAYCQLLLSPMAAKFKVREERVFYETLIYFLNACTCYVIRYEQTDTISELISAVFRQGISDPNTRKQSEFLPITEVVRRHWLSKRVPGKNREEVARTTVKMNTDLVGTVCDKKGLPQARGTSVWDNQGLPEDSVVPYDEKIVNREKLFATPQPKPQETPAQTLVAQSDEASEEEKDE